MTLIELAKSAIETFVKEGRVISVPEGLAKEFVGAKAGVFVTIEQKDKLRGLPSSEPKALLRGLPRSEPKALLRGCIGTYLPARNNIAKEVISNAIAAATEDYRFEPIIKEELPYLSYTVYILSRPEVVSDIKRLDPKKFGIIVQCGQKRGLLLPDLIGIDTVEQQIKVCCRKAGILDNSKEGLIIYCFTVKKYE